ncbi:MAG: hypothetical protein Fur003_1600 [Candidatus Dojkabacteria bacterium]
MITAAPNEKIIPRMNKTIQYMIYSEIITNSAWGLINPIIAVFMSEQIPGANLTTAGIASTLYFVVKSLAQIPFARYFDKNKGEKDDYYGLLLGGLGMALVPVLYIFVATPVHLYLVQIVYGLGAALMYPAWLAIFTRHIDKQKEGIEWSLYYTSIDLAAALTAALGGYLAYAIGFQKLFFIIGAVNLIGVLFLLGIRRELAGRKLNPLLKI